MRHLISVFATVTFALLQLFGTVQAQTYPERPIRFVVPTTPGPMADVLARTLATSMARVLHQTIYVENKPGADQIVGLDYIAEGAPADGYTVGVIGLDGQVLLPLTRHDLTFDPRKDLTFVAGLGDVRYVLAGPATAPYRSFGELMNGAKAHPGKFNFGSSTPQVQLYSLAIARKFGLEVTHIPYSSGAPFVTALVAGDLDWGILAEGTSRPVSSKVRLYAVTGQSRSAISPDVPTFAELGLPEIRGPAYGLVVRNGTPPGIVARLSAAAAEALASADMKASAQKILFDISYQNFAAVQRASNERFEFYQDLIRTTGVKLR